MFEGCFGSAMSDVLLRQLPPNLPFGDFQETQDRGVRTRDLDLRISLIYT